MATASRMGPLRNARHERFCLALSEGRSIAESYAAAGYSKNTGNASRLNANESIQARVAELQAQTAASTKITVESICAELEEAVGVARSKSQAQAMVSAIAFKAKLAGLLVERVEVGNPGDFAGCETTEQIVDQMLAELIVQFRPVDAQDRQALIDHMEEQYRETQEFLDAIRARPICSERADLRHLDRPWKELKAYSPPMKLISGRSTDGNRKGRGN
jgi:Terminase small subunit